MLISVSGDQAPLSDSLIPCQLSRVFPRRISSKKVVDIFLDRLSYAHCREFRLVFCVSFSLTSTGDKNHIRTLGDYPKPSHEGYRNTIELLEGNNVVPLRFNTIRLVKNGCSFHALWERMRMRWFQFSLCDQARNWLERLSVGSISTWVDLTTCFLAQFFPSGRTAKLRNDILMFQQHKGESLSEA
ncbi:zinc finger, CCHC-type containing protein [Tanacetum coccineum]